MIRLWFLNHVIRVGPCVQIPPLQGQVDRLAMEAPPEGGMNLVLFLLCNKVLS